jgi:hypothetical protein
LRNDDSPEQLRFSPNFSGGGKPECSDNLMASLITALTSAGANRIPFIENADLSGGVSAIL